MTTNTRQSGTNFDLDLARLSAEGQSGSMPEALLALLGGGGPSIASVVTGDEVAFHDGQQIQLPRNMSFDRANKILTRLHKESETVTEFERTFNYRYHDGLVAVAHVTKAMFGMTFGEKIDLGFFGEIKPQIATVRIGPGQTVQVPEARMSIPALEGVYFTLQPKRTRNNGRVLHVSVEGARKHRPTIDRFFDAIDHHLRTSSIYRGKAIVGGGEDIDFIDLTTFDSDQIVFSSQASASLEGNLWSVIRHTDAMKREGISPKRSLLLYGPYGTGKSSAGLITAQIAVQNGWTFVSGRAGKDKVEDLLHLAKLYAPAVVFMEDIDGEAGSADDDSVSKLLDAFDGILAKGSEVAVVMTTNHVERIHRGMLRPGRLDAVVEIAHLDDASIQRLIEVLVPVGKLAANIDWVKVVRSMDGFLPAFVRESVQRSKAFAIGRRGGAVDYTIGTADLVEAAESLHPQLQMHNEAGEGETLPTFDQVFRSAVQEVAGQAINGAALLDRDGDPWGSMQLVLPGHQRTDGVARTDDDD